MIKLDLIKAVANKINGTTEEGRTAVDAVLDAISESLERGVSIQLPGFGNFNVKEKAAYTGRNPHTGESIEVPAKMHASFKFGEALKLRVKAGSPEQTPRRSRRTR